MGKISLQPNKCVKLLSKFSTCNSCGESCPTDAISFLEGIPHISSLSCIECGACLSSCPTDAIELEKFSPIETIFKFLEVDEVVLDCKSNIPCISALSTQNLISLAVLKGEDIEANLSHCSTCEIFPKVGEQIEKQLQESNFFLEALNLSQRVVPKVGEALENISHKKRAIFQNSFQNRSLQFDSKEVRKKEIPDSRKLFLMAMKRAKSNSHILDFQDISFISDKKVDDSCTNCQICYRICPTEALSSDYKNSFISFSPNLCLKCGLCHDVCEPDAIQLQNFSISNLFEDSRKLIEFDIRKCYECGNYFTKNSESNMCVRCEIEEQEALELNNWR
jgi:ferredoxin